MQRKREQYDPVIEQVGTYDPYINQYDEKLISLNLERIRFWIGRGALISKPVEELLGFSFILFFLNESTNILFVGLSGLLPIHPTTYMTAWRNRKTENETTENQNVKKNAETII